MRISFTPLYFTAIWEMSILKVTSHFSGVCYNCHYTLTWKSKGKWKWKAKMTVWTKWIRSRSKGIPRSKYISSLQSLSSLLTRDNNWLCVGNIDDDKTEIWVMWRRSLKWYVSKSNFYTEARKASVSLTMKKWNVF